MKGFLARKEIKDEFLMGYFSEVVSMENERQMRFSSQSRSKEPKRVKTVTNVEDNQAKECKKEGKNKDDEKQSN